MIGSKAYMRKIHAKDSQQLQPRVTSRDIRKRGNVCSAVPDRLFYRILAPD